MMFYKAVPKALFVACAFLLATTTPCPAAPAQTSEPRIYLASAGACILHPRRELDHFDNLSIFYVLPKSDPDAVSAPILAKSVEPKFPTDPRERQFSGTVEVALLLDTSGKPQDVYVEKSYSFDFDKNAFEAVKQYRFHPALQNGKPVPVKVCVEINFGK
ncbi:MAG: energy transducer TonB [Candidatus Acidiferrales bacterium]